MTFLKGENCAFLIEESDLNRKTVNTIEIIKSIKREELIDMGKSGLAEINLNYSKEVVTDMYIDLFNKLL